MTNPRMDQNRVLKNARLFVRYLKALAAVCAVAIALVPLPAMGKAPRRMGLRPPTSREVKWAEKNVRRIKPMAGARAVAIPSAVKNIEYLPAVGLQAYGSCVSWAMVYYYKTWQEAKEHGWHRPDPVVNPERVMSPAFVFNLANAGAPLAGTSVNSNAEYLLEYGACTCADLDANADYRNWPQEAQYLAAFPQRAKSVSTFNARTDEGFDMLKTHLASGDLAVFNMTLRTGFTTYPAERKGVRDGVYFGDDGDVYIAGGASSAGHEMCIIGYDDNKSYRDDEGTTHTGAILVVNSWGTGWGVTDPDVGTGGFLWLSYDYFRNASSDVLIMEDRVGYKPKLVGSYHIVHDRALEVSLDLLAGDRNAPDWVMNVFPATGGNRPIDVTVAFDATDYATSDSYSWWLRICDVNVAQFQPNGTGRVTSFKMKRLDGILWESPDCPVETVEVNEVNQYAWANVASLYQKPGLFADHHPAIGSHAWGDLDGDGDLDLTFLDCTESAPWSYHMRTYRNDGGDKFTQIGSGLAAMQGNMVLGDYNCDGLPDLVMNGYDYTSSTYATRLYRNIGDCLFVDSSITLPISEGRIAWVDFDQDGRLDLSFDEYSATSGKYLGIRIYRNTGSGKFADMGITLPDAKQFAWADFNRDGLPDLALAMAGEVRIYRNTGGGLTAQTSLVGDATSGLAWGDVDNDGWLDLALTRSGGYGMAHISEVWRNLGTGEFALYATFPGALGGGMAWGDVDNDGCPDLCVWGDFGGSTSDDRNNCTRVYRNCGAGTFHDLGFNLWGAGFGTGGPFDFVQWLDIDNDGDLDLSVCGPGSIPYPRQLRVYESLAAQAGGLNRPNQPPSVPSGLTVTQAAAGKPVELSWLSSTDRETSSGGLYYDVRAGRLPGWGDLIAPDQSAPFWGSSLRPTLSGNRLGIRLQKVPAEPFYWSVRAIDASQSGSAWSVPQLAVPAGLAKPGDANRDGRIDVADVLTVQRMIGGQLKADLPAADCDLDGKVSQGDTDYVLAQILDRAYPGSALSPRIVASAAVGPAGGSVAASGISLTIPSNSFASSSTVAIERNDGDRPFGSHGNSPVYRIDGLPASFSKPLVLRLSVTGTTTSKTFAMLGEGVHPPSGEMSRRAFRLVQATSVGGGNFTIQIPAAPKQTVAARHSVAATSGASAQGYQLTLYTGLIDDYGVWANSHFSIAFPTSLDFKHVIELGTDLEDAYQMLKSSSAGSLSYAGRTSWPVSVTVLDRQDTGIYGEFIASKLGDNHGWIEINSQNISNYAELRVTAIHEFFHLVQNLYDPRYAFTKAVAGGDQLWLNEAASAWSEALLSAPGYVSPVINNNLLAPFDGLAAGAASAHKKAQDHGYGMASLIRYLIQRNNENNKANVVRRLFEGIQSGKTPTEDVRANGPTATDFTWWPDYMTSLVRGSLYPFGLTDMAAAAPRERLFNVLGDSDLMKLKVYGEPLPDLSGRLHMVVPTYAGLTDKHSLCLRLAKDEGDKLRLAALKAKSGQPTTLIGEGVEANGAWKMEIANLGQLRSEGGWRLLPLVTNQKADDPETGRTNYQLYAAVTTEGSQALPTQSVNVNFLGSQFPVFSCSGTFSGRGWANWQVIDLGVFKMVVADVPALPPIDYNFTYSATLAQSSFTFPPNDVGEYEVWSVPAISGYHLEYYSENSFSAPIDMRSPDGKFSFQLGRNDLYAGGPIYVVYDVVVKRYDSQNHLILETTHTGVESAICEVSLMP